MPLLLAKKETVSLLPSTFSLLYVIQNCIPLFSLKRKYKSERKMFGVFCFCFIIHMELELK